MELIMVLVAVICGIPGLAQFMQTQFMQSFNKEKRSEERFSRNAETEKTFQTLLLNSFRKILPPPFRKILPPPFRKILPYSFMVIAIHPYPFRVILLPPISM